MHLQSVRLTWCTSNLFCLLCPFTKAEIANCRLHCFSFEAVQAQTYIWREAERDQRIWVQVHIFGSHPPKPEEALSSNRYPTSSRAAVLTVLSDLSVGEKRNQRKYFSAGSTKYHFIIVNGGHVIFFHHCGDFWTQNNRYTPGLQKSIKTHSESAKKKATYEFKLTPKYFLRSQRLLSSKQKSSTLKKVSGCEELNVSDRSNWNDL